MSAEALREAVVRVAREMSARSLSRGTSGNVSARLGNGMLVTPSAMPYEEMEASDVLLVDLDGHVVEGERRPSTEWPMHAAIYRARRDVGAIVHAHAIFCTTLSALRRDIPPFHYMVALVGGDSIPCAPYAAFGTPALAAHASSALATRDACLLANHGMVAVGASPAEALDLAREVETLAELYWRAILVGEPALLTPEEMAEAGRRFAARSASGGRE